MQLRLQFYKELLVYGVLKQKYTLNWFQSLYFEKTLCPTCIKKIMNKWSVMRQPLINF